MFDVSTTWSEARAACEALGGHLVTVTSAEEEEAFLERIIQEAGSRKNYWMGAYAPASDNVFEWITGEAFTYTKWAADQPDRDYENRLMMYTYDNPKSSGNTAYCWNNLIDDGTFGSESWFGVDNFGYVCEWDAKPDASLVDGIDSLYTLNIA